LRYKNHECAHQWSGMSISNDGSVRLCCVSTEHQNNALISIDHIADLQAYYNRQSMVDIRNTNYRNNTLCTLCQNKQDVGVTNMRDNIEDLYQSHDIHRPDSPDNCRIEHLDLFFGTVCNQQCLMCNSRSSSKWYSFDAQHQEFGRIPRRYVKWGTTENMDKIFCLVPHLKYLSIKGGEPLIQEEVEKLLAYVQKHNPNLSIGLLTNMQEFSGNMMDLICSSPHLELTVSIDSTGKLYNWIRGGNFEKTMHNLGRYIRGCKHEPIFGIVNTLNRWSIESLVEDICEIESQVAKLLVNSRIIPWYNITAAINPRYVSPFLVPREERLNVVHKFEKQFGMIDTKSKRYGCLYLNYLDTVLSLENDGDTTEEDLRKSNQWQKMINRIR